MQTSLLNNASNLMAGKKVLYVHGFMSSAQSGTVHLLKELMPQAEIIAEDLPLHPQEAIDMLRELCLRHTPAPCRGYRLPETKGKRRQSRPYHRHFYGWNVH